MFFEFLGGLGRCLVGFTGVLRRVIGSPFGPKNMCWAYVSSLAEKKRACGATCAKECLDKQGFSTKSVAFFGARATLNPIKPKPYRLHKSYKCEILQIQLTRSFIDRACVAQSREGSCFTVGA